MSTPRIRLPSRAAPGEIIEVRTLINHPMVTGVATSAPRDMLARFEASIDGVTLFDFAFENGSAANPALSFPLRLERTSTIRFVWTHEDGRRFEAEETVQVG